MSTLSSTAASGLNAQLNTQQFLNLLVTQMENQDPLNPMSSTDFMSQLSQLGVQQGVQQLNSNFSNLLALQQLTQGADLVGKHIVYTNPNGAGVQDGIVSGVVMNQGQLVAMVQGIPVPLGNIQGFEQ